MAFLILKPDGAVDFCTVVGPEMNNAVIDIAAGPPTRSHFSIFS